MERFCVCGVCGNLLGVVNDSGRAVSCCGAEMKVLVANTVEASLEKHVPVVTSEDRKVLVRVGSEAHPMTEDHFISFVAVELESGFCVRKLVAGDEAEVEFCLCGDEKVLAVYAYCNLHGLWKGGI